MTEISSAAIPPEPLALGSVEHVAAAHFIAHAVPAPLPKHDTNPDVDYTIKCVCGYRDDGDSTVYCETCDSWQHIDCYYPGVSPRDVPEEHSCVDCQPRPINALAAAERQRLLRDEQDKVESVDRRVRRSAAGKSHKKKPRIPGQPLTNGMNGDSTDGHEQRTKSPKDHAPPSKRPKTTHKTSASTSARGTSASRSRRSPSKSPFVSATWMNKPLTEQFSDDFLSSYYHEYEDISRYPNIFADMTTTRAISTMVQEPTLKGLDALPMWDQGSDWYNQLSLADTTVASYEDCSKEVRGKHPKWHYLKVNQPVASGHIVGELKGRVGRREDYAQHDSRAKWYRAVHPEPFVFWPTRFSVYVDTRKDGTSIRHVRRSCRPTGTLRTIVVDGRDCHFFLETASDLKQGVEITIGWDFGPLLAKLVHGVKTEDEQVTAADYDRAQPQIDSILADFGGCACDKSVPCAFDRFYSRELLSYHAPTNGVKSKHRPKPSTLATFRPPPDSNDEEDDDSRSTTGSIKSKPQSRDLTPMTHISSEAPNGPEMSDREHRKLMARVNLINQVAEPLPRKKKRSSAGSALNTPSAISTRHLGINHSPNSADPDHSPETDSPNFFRFPHQDGYSPVKAPKERTLKPIPRHSTPIYPSNYTSCATQTDDEPDAWYTPPAQTSPRREFVPIAIRLLRQCHEKKKLFEQHKKRKADEVAEQQPSKRFAAGTETPVPQPIMMDAVMNTSPDHFSPTLSSSTSQMPSAPQSSLSSPVFERPSLPSVAAAPENAVAAAIPTPAPQPTLSNLHSHTQPQSNGINRGAELRVTLPATPTFVNSTSGSMNPYPSTPSALTPTPFSATPSLVSPSLNTTLAATINMASNMPAPSPIKKKLSLSDYAKRRAMLPSGGSVLQRKDSTSSPEDKRKREGDGEDTVMKDAPPTPSTPVEVSAPQTPSIPEFTTTDTHKAASKEAPFGELPPPPLPPSAIAAQQQAQQQQAEQDAANGVQ